MEIERKWMVKGLPFFDHSDNTPAPELPVLFSHLMRQGYISVRPTVRIREEAVQGGSVEYVLCFKSEGGLARKEIELSIERDKFEELEDLIGKPMIPKLRITYALPDGHHLEVNHVDEGQPTEFWYAEVEYASVDEAESWRPENVGLSEYLSDEVTGLPGQSMGAYWIQTRLEESVPGDML